MSWIIPLSIGLIVSIVLSIVYKNKPKKDKGFQFVYYGLSYRRKLIRTLFSLPFTLLVIWLAINSEVFPPVMQIVLTIFMIILSAGQLGYNYYMYKKYES